MTRLSSYLRRIFGTFCIGCGSVALAQPSPVDLSIMSIEALLEIEVTAPSENGDEVTFASRGGSLNLQYRYTQMRFEGYLDGTKKLSFDDVLVLFPVVPTLIVQEAQTLEASYDWDNWSVGLLLPWIKQSTDHIARKADPFNITTEGIGDVDLSLARRHGKDNDIWIFRGSVSLPTGSIEETGTTPRGPGTLVPYTMQLGSGTVDVEPSVAYVCQRDSMQIGAQALATVRLGRNDRNYSLSDRIQLGGWASYKVTSWFEPSAKLNWISWTDIDGEDSALDPKIAPVADAELYGGHRLDGILSATFRIPKGGLEDLSFSAQAGIPLYEDLTGPQPGQDYQLSLAASWNF